MADRARRLVRAVLVLACLPAIASGLGCPADAPLGSDAPLADGDVGAAPADVDSAAPGEGPTPVDAVASDRSVAQDPVACDGVSADAVSDGSAPLDVPDGAGDGTASDGRSADGSDVEPDAPVGPWPAPPGLSGVEDTVVTLDAGFDPWEGVTAWSELDGDLTAQITLTGAVDPHVSAAYSLTYEVADSADQLTAATRTVTVQDPPDCAPDFTDSDSAYGLAWTTSPYAHGCTERPAGTPSFTPSAQGDAAFDRLVFARVFDRAREVHGYDPRFVPGRVYFDDANLPWLYVNNANQLDLSTPTSPQHVSPVTGLPTGKALHQLTYDSRLYDDLFDATTPCAGCDAYLLRLTADARWLATSIAELAASFGFKANPHGMDASRYGLQEQVYFQDGGDVYVKQDHGVLRYRAATGDWAGYPRDWLGAATMVGDGGGPPVFVKDRHSAQPLVQLYTLEFDADGGGSVVQTDLPTGLFTELKESSQSVALVDGVVHVAMLRLDDQPGREDHNSANYYVRYDVASGALDTLFMGWTGSTSEAAPDSHNQPALLVDSAGYLHYLSGAHNHGIWHRRSLAPVTDPGWGGAWAPTVDADAKFTPGRSTPVAQFPEDTPPEAGVDVVGDPLGRYTYVHPRIDAQDVIHVVMRNSRQPEGGRKSYRLEYVRGIPTGGGDVLWQDRQVLVEPSWGRYSNYTPKLHQDRRGNVYATFTYEVQNFDEAAWFNAATFDVVDSEAECAGLSVATDCLHVKSAHQARWPDEPLSGPSTRYSQEHPHDPTLLGTADFGETWTLTTTAELLARAASDPVVALSAVEVTGAGAATLLAVAKGGSAPHVFEWTVDGEPAGQGVPLPLAALSPGEHTATVTVDGVATHTSVFVVP